MSWFITRCHLKIIRYPEYGDILKIRTWPKGRKRVFAYRDLELSLGNEIIGIGSSVWCLIDPENQEGPVSFNGPASLCRER